MIDGRRHAATLPTEADARVWEVETRAAAIQRRGAASMTFADYVEYWLEGIIEDPGPGAVRGKCRHLILEDAAEDLRARAFDVAPSIVANRASG